MTNRSTTALLGALESLRTDLIDRAFALEQRGRVDAADVAIAAAARLEELCEEFSPARNEAPRLVAANSP